MKNIIQITFDDRDPKSIRAAEKKKLRCENAGYTLTNTEQRLTKWIYTYKK